VVTKRRSSLRLRILVTSCVAGIGPLLVLALLVRGAATHEVADELARARIRGKTEASAEPTVSVARIEKALGDSWRQATILTVIGGIASFLVFAGAGFMIARGATRPILEAAQVLRSLADGDLSRRMSTGSATEAGDLAEFLNRALDEFQSTIHSVVTGASGLGRSTDHLTDASNRMAVTAESTSTEAGRVSSSAVQVRSSVESVATATEEMTASIREIARNASDAATVAAKALEMVESTNAAISKLGESNREIGSVIKVITSIAEQTNLLALNATIEAARAGEAGKGFAVVANEVKELAKETAKATETIGQRLTTIQDDTLGAVQAIGEICNVIHHISEISTSIAGAVEEQSATTDEIGRSISEAAAATQWIAQSTAGLVEAMQTTVKGATATRTSAREMNEMTRSLEQLVSRFKVIQVSRDGFPERPSGTALAG